MKKYQYFLQSENKTAEGFADTTDECKKLARQQLQGDKYDINEITIVKCESK